ncbi:MAG: hypothetical protein L0027_11050 [Candidatus Rokubacteria bacterium]|nr:hypothetical protein [Candidatus Rokubacteria bacterium]
MKTRFTVDLLNPGSVGETWQEWFVGPEGRRHLVLSTLVAMGVFLLVLVAGILPSQWRLGDDAAALPKLRQDLAASEADLGKLRTNLSALSAEARRQFRWSELLSALSRQAPPNLRLQTVEVTQIPLPVPEGQAPRPGQPPPTEPGLRIEALTPLQPGSSPLLDVAQFMAGLMRDPAVSRRFQLRSWDIKTPSPAGEGGAMLLITIVLAERPS